MFTFLILIINVNFITTIFLFQLNIFFQHRGTGLPALAVMVYMNDLRMRWYKQYTQKQVAVRHSLVYRQTQQQYHLLCSRRRFQRMHSRNYELVNTLYVEELKKVHTVAVCLQEVLPNILRSWSYTESADMKITIRTRPPLITKKYITNEPRQELKIQMALRVKSGLFPVQWQCKCRTLVSMFFGGFFSIKRIYSCFIYICGLINCLESG